eukprot:TRINITY_DN9484_c0_g1_i1.p1 TRINITY_DN9484_c0_g1~~TRINITY_DN9484_c0_g1_i1.p1  ORF type:complete len:266 (-),score=53.99 TRINITY_DN9484_c0_g1_i1:57-833(-)
MRLSTIRFIFILLIVVLVDGFYDSWTWKVLKQSDFRLGGFQFLRVIVQKEHSSGTANIYVTSKSVKNQGSGTNMLFMKKSQYDGWVEYGEYSDNCIHPDKYLNSPNFTQIILGNDLCGSGHFAFVCEKSVVWNYENCRPPSSFLQNSFQKEIYWEDEDGFVILFYSPDRVDLIVSFEISFNPHVRNRWINGSITALVFAFLLIVITILAGCYLQLNRKKRFRHWQMEGKAIGKAKKDDYIEDFGEDETSPFFLKQRIQ